MKKVDFKKRFVVVIVFVYLLVVGSSNLKAHEIIQDKAARNILYSLNENNLPSANDILTIADRVDSTKISLTPISEKSKFLLDKLNLNGITILTEKKDSSFFSKVNPCKEYELNVFQLEKDGVFVSPEQIKPLLYENPHEYNGGFSEYNVFGTIKLTIAEHPTKWAWKISSVSASTVAGTQAVKTSQIHIRAISADPYIFDELKDKYISNPSNSTFYTLYPNFSNYNSVNGHAFMQAAARFALNNGRSFTLLVKVRGEDLNPYDSWVVYDTEMGGEE